MLVAHVRLFYRWWSGFLVNLAYRDPCFGFLIDSYGYSIVRLSGLTDCGFLAVEGPAVSFMFCDVRKQRVIEEMYYSLGDMHLSLGDPGRRVC